MFLPHVDNATADGKTEGTENNCVHLSTGLAAGLTHP